MPRFAANLSMMFNEVPFLDRFDAAAKAGFTAVEFLFPYDHPAEAVGEPAGAPLQLDPVRAATHRHGQAVRDDQDPAVHQLQALTRPSRASWSTTRACR